jgi:hypothetical protein
MILHQVGSLSFDASLAHSRIHTVGIDISVNDDIGLSEKAILLPMWARTCLPWFTAQVAELGSTMTGYDIN